MLRRASTDLSSAACLDLDILLCALLGPTRAKESGIETGRQIHDPEASAGGRVDSDAWSDIVKDLRRRMSPDDDDRWV
jgi:hypothetical protein